MKKTLFPLFLIFTGCDMYTHYSLSIDNQTEHTVEIVFTEDSPYHSLPSESLTFPPLTKEILYSAEGTQVKNGCNYTGILEGEVHVNISSGQQLSKKIWIVDNWECSGSNKVGWKQTFVITNDDLE